MRQGFTEWAAVTAVLVLAAAFASAWYGREIRAAFGVHRPVAAAAAPAYPPAPWPLR